MKRIHLFEFEDLEWFPKEIRNYGTDFLQFLSNKSQLYSPVVPVLHKALELSNTNQVIDLGSGGGGGLIWLSDELRKKNPDLKILLTDYYPNIPAFKRTTETSDVFDFLEESIDARDVPEKLKGLRTQFLSLHHFREKDARMILQNAVNTQQNIAIFEAQERSFISILLMLISPLSVLLTTPFIRPFKIGRLIFTYLIPIVPLFVLWDGVVSCLRTYSVPEMEALVDSLENKGDFNWEIKRIKEKGKVVLNLLGTKK